MAEINLLPWREEKREHDKKQFNLMLLFSFLIAVFILLATNYYAGVILESQEERNTILRNEIKRLDIQTKEIKKLKKIRMALISRMNIIQNLQETRPLMVRLVDEVVKVMPKGAHLVKLERVGEQVIMTGYAMSNSSVSLLMRNIEKSKWIHSPLLSEIKTKKVNDKVVNEFKLSFYLKPNNLFNFKFTL